MGLSDLLIYNGTTPLPLILWALYVGVAIAIIASYIVRDKYGNNAHTHFYKVEDFLS